MSRGSWPNSCRAFPTARSLRTPGAGWLHLGQDLSIGYLSHDVTSIQLYFQESLTFVVYTGEAVVALNGAPAPTG